MKRWPAPPWEEKSVDLAHQLARRARQVVDGGLGDFPAVDQAIRKHLFDACVCWALAAVSRAASVDDHLSALSGRPPETWRTANLDSDLDRLSLLGASLVRSLDANDTFVPRPGGSFGHFSEIVPMALHVVRQAGSVPVDALALVGAAYEVMGWVLDANRVEELGFHPASVEALGAATVCGLAEGLDDDALANGLRLAWTLGSLPNTWLGPKGGKIGEFKTVAPGWSAWAGVRAISAVTAGLGLPPGGLEISGLVAGEGRQADVGAMVLQVAHKMESAQIHLQSVAEAGLRLHDDGVRLADIEQVRLHGHSRMTAGVQGSAGAFHPTSHSEADHSCPFVFMMSVEAGHLTPAVYGDEPWADPAVIDALQRVELILDADAERAFQTDRVWRLRTELRTTSGRDIRFDTVDFVGAPSRPASWDQLEGKFRRFVGHDRAAAKTSTIARLRATCADELVDRRTSPGWATRLLETVDALVGP